MTAGGLVDWATARALRHSFRVGKIVRAPCPRRGIAAHDFALPTSVGIDAHAHLAFQPAAPYAPLDWGEPRHRACDREAFLRRRLARDHLLAPRFSRKLSLGDGTRGSHSSRSRRPRSNTSSDC